MGDNSPRRNWLTATFPSGDPLGPLTVYAMTRVLPIVRAMGNVMIDVALPNEATAGQVMACQSTLVAALGWQLGELYDAAMRPKVGDDWLEQLRQARLQAAIQPPYTRRS